MRKNLLLALMFLAGAALNIQPGHALDSDSEQPATLDADDMEMDFSTGLRIYRGNVVFRQGSIKMTCEELTTYFSDEGELDKAICVGNPGSFKQRPEGQDKDMVGTARSITMNRVDDLVILKSRAKVVQGNSTITGSLITYNMITEKASIKGGGSQSSGSESQSTGSESADGATGSEDAATEVEEDSNARPSLVIQPRKIKPVEETPEDTETDGDASESEEKKEEG